MSLDLTKFKWFEYDENAAPLRFDQDRHNVDYALDLHPGNVYGVKKRAHGIFVVHENSPDIQFSLNDQEYTRINQHSKGWSGKIKRVAVKAGVGGLDKPSLELPAGWKRIDLDSSNLNTVIYDTKRKVLYVAFHNGASWAYENVTMKEFKEMEAAESRGRFFIYRIKYVKPQYKLGDNFDQPPFNVEKTSPSVMPVNPADKQPTEKTPAAKAVKEPKKPAKKPAAKPGQAALKIPRGALDTWMGSEEGSYEDHHVGNKPPDHHVYKILQSGKIEKESDVFALLKSLANSSFVAADKRAFNTAAKSLLSVTDEYPFSAEGVKQYRAARNTILDMIKQSALNFM
jgi:hypothetical protein